MEGAFIWPSALFSGLLPCPYSFPWTLHEDPQRISQWVCTSLVYESSRLYYLHTSPELAFKDSLIIVVELFLPVVCWPQPSPMLFSRSVSHFVLLFRDYLYFFTFQASYSSCNSNSWINSRKVWFLDYFGF